MATTYTPRGDPFPKKPEDFLHDERCSHSAADDKWILVDNNGQQWEWNVSTSKWFQPATEEEIALYQQAYGGPVEDEEIPAQEKNKKRKQAPNAANAANKKPKVQENRAIYVTKLPLDATAEEIAKEFGKYGIIDQSTDGEKRIKMYLDDNGDFKGEALIVYFRKDSVAMAIRMADDYWFRPGDTQKVCVQEADLQYKRHQDGQEVKLVRKDKKANERNRAELNRKLAEWSDDDDAAKEAHAPAVNKWAKIVIIKNMFTLDDLEKDPEAILDIKEAVRDDAAKSGEFTNVVLYDKEPEGIMSVRFKKLEDAQEFRNRCNGRTFDDRVVTAWHAEDKPKFKKSKVTDEKEDSD